ncbi:MAG: hydroxymethylbilane synthase [Candidatus Marinimicrobia bacterium]|nr:hydroxymethylbilane synthase [Candidatus Neomarinimicrobiota bacterium]
MKKILLGTRGSQLALWQAEYVRNLLLKNIEDIEVAIEVIKTIGDQIKDKPLPDIGRKGLFTKEIEDALLEEQIHVAVHSLKDLSSTLPDGLVYAGSPPRADCRDTFLSNRWQSLKSVPKGGRIATGSVRRRALVKAENPHVICQDLRGNIKTRLRKLKVEDWDGIIMAAAALERLGLVDDITEYLDPETFVPSVGQGAIGLEVKETREDVLLMMRMISDPDTVTSVTAERAFMHHLGGGCSVPIGAWGRLVNGQLNLIGYFATVSGKRFIRKTAIGPLEEPETLGIMLAERFKALGVEALMPR